MRPSNLNPPGKIVTYLLLTALMVASFTCAMVINNTAYGGIGWVVLLVLNLGILGYLLRR